MELFVVIVFVILLLCISTFIFYASYSISSGIYLKALCHGETKERVVSLTFDDGPDEANTPQVLNVLKQYQAPATFFCIGKKGEADPALLRRIVAEGHLIGNHSYSHSGMFPLYSPLKMETDLRQAAASLEQITGKKIVLFRPPFGVTNPNVARVVRRLGYTTIGWSIRSFDTNGETEDTIFSRIIKQIVPGSVILLHDRMPGSASLLIRLLDYLKVNNYKVISTNEMFNE